MGCVGYAFPLPYIIGVFWGSLPCLFFPNLQAPYLGGEGGGGGSHSDIRSFHCVFVSHLMCAQHSCNADGKKSDFVFVFSLSPQWGAFILGWTQVLIASFFLVRRGSPRDIDTHRMYDTWYKAGLDTEA